MSRRHIVLFIVVAIALLVAGVAGWVWYTQARMPPTKVVLSGTSVATDHLSISSGNLVVIAPKPGLYFGTVRRPGSPEEFTSVEFTYVIVFRYGADVTGGSTERLQSHVQASGNVGTTKDALQLGDKQFEVTYRIELNDTRTAIANETLTINGERVDASAGRVFLIDLTEDAPVFRQKKFELPSIQSKLDTTAEIERAAEAIRAKLEGQDEEIREFLR